MGEKLSTGSRELDLLLEGGYDCDILTTIYGPAGSGKTNLCLMCASLVARSKKVLFIDTEGNFSVERLRQIDPDTVLENLLILKPSTFSEQKKVFSELNKLLNPQVGLIIVDTVVMLYRIERGKTEAYKLNRELGLQISYLSELARTHQIPVLVTSQVYSPLGNKEEVRLVGGDLLNYASKCIIELQNLNGGRRLIVKKHRSLPSRSLDFRIVERGIQVLTPR